MAKGRKKSGTLKLTATGSTTILGTSSLLASTTIVEVDLIHLGAIDLTNLTQPPTSTPPFDLTSLGLLIYTGSVIITGSSSVSAVGFVKSALKGTAIITGSSSLSGTGTILSYIPPRPQPIRPQTISYDDGRNNLGLTYAVSGTTSRKRKNIKIVFSFQDKDYNFEKEQDPGIEVRITKAKRKQGTGRSPKVSLRSLKANKRDWSWVGIGP